MTNLTEKWIKGELPDGFYWIEFKDGEITSTTFSNLHGFICCDSVCDNENIKQILEEMPSFKEYQKLLSDQLAKNEGEEINAELEERLKKTQELELELRRENAKLKELLKEVQSKIRYSTPTGIETFADLDDRLLGEINQVLGDKTDEQKS